MFSHAVKIDYIWNETELLTKSNLINSTRVEILKMFILVTFKRMNAVARFGSFRAILTIN